jgi:preprotein translocase subunit YajC
MMNEAIKLGGNFMYALLSSAQSMGLMIVIYAVIIGVFWFFLIRPQNKEKKRVSAMLADLAVGDTVLTTSGFYGVIIDISDEDVIVEFGNNKNCRIPMQKAAIMQVEKAGE